MALNSSEFLWWYNKFWLLNVNDALIVYLCMYVEKTSLTNQNAWSKKLKKG